MDSNLHSASNYLGDFGEAPSLSESVSTFVECVNQEEGVGKRVYLKDPPGPAIWGSSPQAAATPSFLPLFPAAPS